MLPLLQNSSSDSSVCGVGVAACVGAAIAAAAAAEQQYCCAGCCYHCTTAGRNTVAPLLLQLLSSLTTIRVLVGTKNSCLVGFYSRNSTKSTVKPNTTIHKHYHHGGAICSSFGMGSMDPPDRTRVTSSEGVGRGGGGSDLIKSIK